MKKLIFLLLFYVVSFTGFGQTEIDVLHTLKFNRVLHILKSSYVDSVNIEKSVEDAIIGMLEKLDPHSVYLTKEEAKKANEPLEGSFEGIGIQFQIIRDTIYVISTISGGPSELVGVMAGDQIVSIDGKDFTGSKINNSVVMETLRGKKGTKVVVGIYRYPLQEILDFEIIRDVIPIYSLDASFMVDSVTGYIKLNRFSRTTLDEFNDALAGLQKQNIKNLILDLRNNSGGYLMSAVNLADQFFESDKLIVYTKGLNAMEERYKSSNKGGFKTGKLIILVDESSASASEIVAGAVQDWDRGLIIGRRTFGKGLVQKPFTMSDGSLVRLTTARYYTPTGRSIQKPYDDDKKKYIQELSSRLEKGELIEPDSISFPDSLLFNTSAERVVYGGGGIMPDIFVPVDTASLAKYYTDVLRKNIVNMFISDYMRDNRKKLSGKFNSVAKFKKDFDNYDNNFMEAFFSYAEENGVEKQEIDDVTYIYLHTILKSHIARNIFDSSAFFQVIMDVSDEVQKAIEVIYKDEYFEKISYK